MWLLADMMQTGMFLAGIALLALVLLRRIYRHYGRRRPAAKGRDAYLATSPRPASDRRSLSSAPPELLRWHVEMHETARDLSAQLDSKMRVLQLLIGQARQEADRLERLLDHGEHSDSVDPARPGPTSTLPVPAEQQTEICDLADAGRSAADIAHQLSLPVGDVEWVLSLRGSRRAGRSTS
jgi:hypothetical protein